MTRESQRIAGGASNGMARSWLAAFGKYLVLLLFGGLTLLTLTADIVNPIRIG